MLIILPASVWSSEFARKGTEGATVSTSGSKVLRGSIPPIITPFRNGKVDYEAYAGLLEFQLKEGTHGILVNGTSSEPSTLTTEERNRLVDVAVATVKG